MLSDFQVARKMVGGRGVNACDVGRMPGVRFLGPKSLSHDRALSKAHIKVLAKHFNVSPAVLLD